MRKTVFFTVILTSLFILFGCGPNDGNAERSTAKLAFSEHELDGLVMMNQDYINGGGGDNFQPSPGASLLIFTPGVLWAIGVEAHIGEREKYLWEIGRQGQLVMTRYAGTNREHSCELWKLKDPARRDRLETRFKCDRSSDATVTVYHLPQTFSQSDMHNLTLTFKDDDNGKRDIVYTPENIRKRLEYYNYKTVVNEPYITGDYKNSLIYPIYAVTPSPNSGKARLLLFGHPEVSEGTLLELGYSTTLESIPGSKRHETRIIGHKLHSVSLIKNLVYGDPQNKYDLHSRRDLERIPY